MKTSHFTIFALAASLLAVVQGIELRSADGLGATSAFQDQYPIDGLAQIGIEDVGDEYDNDDIDYDTPNKDTYFMIGEDRYLDEKSRERKKKEREMRIYNEKRSEHFKKVMKEEGKVWDEHKQYWAEPVNKLLDDFKRDPIGTRRGGKTEGHDQAWEEGKQKREMKDEKAKFAKQKAEHERNEAQKIIEDQKKKKESLEPKKRMFVKRPKKDM